MKRHRLELTDDEITEALLGAVHAFTKETYAEGRGVTLFVVASIGGTELDPAEVLRRRADDILRWDQATSADVARRVRAMLAETGFDMSDSPDLVRMLAEIDANEGASK